MADKTAQGNASTHVKGRWHFSLRAVLLIVLVAALGLAIYVMPREKVARWIFGGGYVSKTEFTAREVEHLENAIGLH